jgi:hypothetical protein
VTWNEIIEDGEGNAAGGFMGMKGRKAGEKKRMSGKTKSVVDLLKDPN